MLCVRCRAGRASPRSQPANSGLTFLVKLDPASGQEFYANVLTKATSWELPDPDAEAQAEASRTDTEESRTPPTTVTCLRRNLPFEPLRIHCWRPVYNAAKSRFLYINCETDEQVIRLPPIWDYCDAIRQFYEHYNIGLSYVDVLQDCRGKEEELLNTLSIQYGPKPPTESEVMEITEMYLKKYDMSMLSEIDDLLIQWRGNEIGLLQELQKEYGGRRPRTMRERVRAIYAQ
ncbi:hypothetical protein LSM04_000527 [Trypanosoma melophagium]|uniref:uncharacterized protein n=1 Tax=Trypanosoma melophagium TaxID=715481 RepID=UPI003519DE0A|nr:hypothetical protein LSM04_000527 [Trypanosoma melophagium]